MMTVLMFSGELMASSIEIFTLNSRSVSLNGHTARLCLLDEINILTERLNKKLEVSENAFEGSLQEIDSEPFQKAFECQLAALNYELKALPAIVFDGREVVYGYEDLDEALALKEGYHD